MHNCRNEIFQEQMWTKTFESLKDYLSPETMEKYGPATKSEVATDNQVNDQEGDVVVTGNQEEIGGAS